MKWLQTKQNITKPASLLKYANITFVSENISFTFLNFFTLEMAYQSDEIYLNEIDLTDENENNTTTKGSANVLNFIPWYLFWFTVPTVYKHFCLDIHMNCLHMG